MRSHNSLPAYAVFTAMLFSLVGSLLPTSVGAQSQQWDTRWVPADTFFFATVNVQNMLNYEAEDSEIRTFLSEKLKKQVHFDLENVLQAQMFMSGTLADDESFDADGDRLLVLKTIFSEPQDFSKLIEMMGDDFEQQEIGGHKIMVPESEYQPSLCFPDKQTMLVGKESALKQALANEKSMSGMIDRIRAADANNHDIYIAFEQNETTRQLMEMLAAEAEGLPFDLADIAGEAVSGEVNVRFEDGKPIRAQIKAKNAEGAQRLQRAVDALVGLGKGLLPMGRTALKEQEVPDFGGGAFKEFMEEQQRLQLAFLDIGEKVLEGFATSTQEETLNIEVTAMGGISDVVRLVGEQIQSVLKMSDGVVHDAEIEFEEAADEAGEDAAERIEASDAKEE